VLDTIGGKNPLRRGLAGRVRCPVEVFVVEAAGIEPASTRGPQTVLHA
jgi:hypothetical protein